MLELGTAKVDITPRFRVPLAGFEIRTGLFDGVLAPLFARIFCFRSQAAPPVVLVSADLIWWGSERVTGMRQRIRAQSGLEKASIILHATHNHCGPQTSASCSPLIGEARPAYLETSENAVMSGITEAFGAFEPVAVERGAGQCRIGSNRRRLVDGSIHMAPNREGLNDPECTVIRFRTPSGYTKAVLVHFTCHPTTTADNNVSAEFCGAAMTDIESELGNDVIAAFLQGCCGDIRPALIRNDQFYRGDAEDVRRLGSELSSVVAAVLSKPMYPCGEGACSSLETELPLFFDNFSGEPLERESVPMEMTRIMLAPNLGFLTFNAEPVVAYGLFVKRQSGRTVLPLGYSNGMIGYVTTERQLGEGGYESREAFRYFGMPGPFAMSTERRLHEAIRVLLGVWL